MKEELECEHEISYRFKKEWGNKIAGIEAICPKCDRFLRISEFHEMQLEEHSDIMKMIYERFVNE